MQCHLELDFSLSLIEFSEAGDSLYLLQHNVEPLMNKWLAQEREEICLRVWLHI